MLTPPIILLDTDIGPDCDDAAALALLNLYASAGRVSVAAITHCTSNPYGAGAIRAIDRWYGHDFPVGTTAREGFLGGEDCQRYNKDLARDVPESPVPEAVSLLRKTLAGLPDASAILVSIGPLNNVAALLRSAPDAASPFDGASLAARKCRRLVSMAGCFERAEGYPRVEWNVEMDVPAARDVVELWPTEMVWCGWEMGVKAPCGGTMADLLPPEHPVRRAYALHNASSDRPSWDLLTTRFACLDPDSAFDKGPSGRIALSETGESRFTPDPQGRHYALRFAISPETVARQLDDTLTRGKI